MVERGAEIMAIGATVRCAFPAMLGFAHVLTNGFPAPEFWLHSGHGLPVDRANYLIAKYIPFAIMNVRPIALAVRVHNWMGIDLAPAEPPIYMVLESDRRERIEQHAQDLGFASDPSGVQVAAVHQGRRQS